MIDPFWDQTHYLKLSCSDLEFGRSRQLRDPVIADSREI